MELYIVPIKDGEMHFQRRLRDVAFGYTKEDRGLGIGPVTVKGMHMSLAESAGVVLLGLEHVDKSAPPAYAFVSSNRWGAKCPDCAGGAEYVFTQDPVFHCNYCHNAKIGGRWRRVVWPKNRAEIEDILRCRVDPMTRNWDPGTSLEQLRKENHERGEAISTVELSTRLGPQRVEL